MKATRELPSDYHEVGSIDLKKDTRLPVLLSVAGVALFLGFAWLFSMILGRMRPEEGATGLAFRIEGVLGLLGLLLTVALVLVAVVVVHEAVHAAFLWLFTRSRPKFDVGVGYVSTGAPDWYLPRGPYLIVAVAPLLVLTVLGLVALAVVPTALLAPTLMFLALNAGGAVGDLVIAGLALRQPADSLINDRGDKVTVYRLVP